MKYLRVVPYEMPTTLEACGPGLFLFRIGESEPSVGIKTEYGCFNAHTMEVYCVDSGEVFWGGKDDVEERGKLVVLPAKLGWVQD